MGGLIIKTAVQKPNTDLWYQLAKVSPELGDEIEISPQVYLGDLVQWEPVQFVERLVFIASPLKGVPPSIFKESLARIILPRIFSHQSHSKLFDQITSSISYILEDSPSIQFLLHTPMPQTLKWDSIAAVAGANWWHRFIGDLADPLVPLSKSILENSDNVLVVRNAWHMNVHMCDETINLVKSIATLT